MGIAGNSGNQTMTLMIRSIALGQVTGGNTRRLMLKELAIAALNGVVWGGIAGLVAWRTKNVVLTIVAGLVVFFAMQWALG